VFHVELRQFPHVARAFNLDRQQLHTRILAPWVKGQLVELDDRHWTPQKAKLAIYEGPELRPDQIGMGRGWSAVTKSSTEVTERVLQELVAPTAELKQLVVERSATGPLPLQDVVMLVPDRAGGLRASNRLELAEQAVWELLHQKRVSLIAEGAVLPQDQWEATLLEWGSWTRPGLELGRFN
jgi:hypothetical protein